MRILLDTCTFLWLALDSDRLSKAARELFTNPENEVFLSVVSAWEMAVKFKLGKLSLPKSPAQCIPQWREDRGITSLSLEEESSLHETRLPALHRDPFDRMLVCQSIVHGLTLLTPDPLITQYPAHVMW